MRISKTTEIIFNKETESQFIDRANEIFRPSHWLRKETSKDVSYVNVEGLVLPAVESSLFRSMKLDEGKE